MRDSTDRDAGLNSYRGLRCLVTGGAGFIGSNLSRRLLDLEASVTVVDNFVVGSPDRLPASPRLRVIEADLRSTPLLPALLAESDVVFHLAAQVGNVKSIAEPESDAATNLLGTVRLLDACRGTAVRKLVYSSSSAIFGEAEVLPVHEDHPQRPASFYALSKWGAERYTLLAHELWGVPGVCLRYFNVYGLPMEDNEYTGVISIFFRRLISGEPLTIFGQGDQMRDFVYVDDVVQANLLAALHATPGRVYNIGSGVSTDVAELAKTMCAVTGKAPGIHLAPARAGEVRRSTADITRARHELGYQPAWTLARGLQSMWDVLTSA